MGDRLRAGKLSRYVTSRPGQLSLAIPLWVGTMSTILGWESNRRSGVALAMRHRHSGLSTRGLNGLWKEDEHPAYAPSEYGPFYLYYPNPSCVSKLNSLNSTVAEITRVPKFLWCPRSPVRANIWTEVKVVLAAYCANRKLCTKSEVASSIITEISRGSQIL